MIARWGTAVRKQGAVSMARRSLTKKEFTILLQVFKTQSLSSKNLELDWEASLFELSVSINCKGLKIEPR
jgi:hypothetical protein